MLNDRRRRVSARGVSLAWLAILTVAMTVGTFLTHGDQQRNLALLAAALAFITVVGIVRLRRNER